MKVELNEESIKHINRLLQSLPISTYEIVKEITEAINKGLVEEWVMDYAERVFTLLIEKYDKIFYLIPEFDIEDDGVRSTDIDFRNEIVTIFNEYIIECEIPVIQLTGSVDNRVSLIVEELKNE